MKLKLYTFNILTTKPGATNLIRKRVDEVGNTITQHTVTPDETNIQYVEYTAAMNEINQLKAQLAECNKLRSAWRRYATNVLRKHKANSMQWSIE